MAVLKRTEDARLLTGTSTFVADIAVTGCLDAAFARSPVAFGRVTRIDTGPASAMPGVVAVVSGADLAGVPPVPLLMAGDAAAGRDWWPLAGDRVRYHGEPVAMVLAEDRYLADDAAAAVVLDILELPPVLTPAESKHAPNIHVGASNLAFTKQFGPPVADRTWREAAVVVAASYRQPLLAPTSLEARAILVIPDGDRLDVWCSHQHPHALQQGLATSLGLPPDQVRVQVPDAGGAFGAKSPVFPEYVAAAVLARRLRRPVRWIEDRIEALTAATRGRGQDQRIRMAADADGRITAIDLGIDADIGAYPVGAGIPGQTGLQASGPYAVPEVHAEVRSWLTTTTPTFAYRGAGRPEATYAIERTVELLADRLGMDSIELRRRNFVRSADFPYDTPTGRRYDSGEYETALDLALHLLELTRWRAEQARRRADPDAWPLGIGIASYVERSGGEPGILEEFGSVTACPDGTFEARVGTSATGQSHETVFAGVVADALGVAAADVRVIEADTDEVPRGNGSFASRSLQMGGAALHEAAGAFVVRARERAAELLGIDVADTEWKAGHIVVRGEATLTVADLVADSPVSAEYIFSSPAAFPYGTYAAVVEVDPELGAVQVLRLVAVDDYGTVIDEAVVRGQTLGSSAQGLGQALYETVPLDEAGRTDVDYGLLDYLLPTIAEMPPMLLAETAVANPNNPLGAKGAGEAGCIGVPPAVANAVVDALRLSDPDSLQLPFTPQTVWRAMRE